MLFFGTGNRLLDLYEMSMTREPDNRLTTRFFFPWNAHFSMCNNQHLCFPRCTSLFDDEHIAEVDVTH